MGLTLSRFQNQFAFEQLIALQVNQAGAFENGTLVTGPAFVWRDDGARESLVRPASILLCSNVQRPKLLMAQHVKLKS